MPPLSIPSELKPITPFVRRAEELDKDSGRPESRLVAYYCRQYAVHTGLPVANSTPGAQTCLMTLLEQLEQEKKTMDQFTKPEAEYLCRQFAYQVFDKADAEDRAGKANKATAKTFYTCASFLQMLEQFYPTTSEKEEETTADAEPTEDMQEDKKRALYAKWKATEILKAIKEGRTPQPGGYGEQKETEEEEDTPMTDASPPEDEFHIPPPPTGMPAATTSTTEEKDAPHDEVPPKVSTVENDDDEEEEEAMDDTKKVVEDDDQPADQGQEMIFQDDDDDDDNEPALPPPPAYQNIPPAVPPPAPTPAKASGWFGGKKKKSTNKPATKAQMADAMELTRFALAALEDKNATMAAERLQQALEALGH